MADVGVKLCVWDNIVWFSRLQMFAAPCSPSSSIFSEMLELNAARSSTKRGNSEEEGLSVGSFDASKSSPVFFGRYGHKLSESAAEVHEGDDDASTRSSVFLEFDPSVNHPATFGHVLLDRKPAPPKQESPPPPHPKECKCSIASFWYCVQLLYASVSSVKIKFGWT